MQTLTIDPEFKQLIPPLTELEYQQLEANLLADGCRDPLVVWNGVLIDGHNRYEICNRHDKPFDTVAMDFSGRGEVLLWIIRNQLGRRNLNVFTRGELALRLKPVLAEQARENMLATQNNNTGKAALTNLSKLENINTREELSGITGTSEGTFSKIEYLTERAPEEVKQALRRGDVSVDGAFKEARQAEQKAERQARRLEEKPITMNHPSYVLGNCLDVLPTLQPKTVRLLFSDPPYGMGYQSNRRTASDQLPAIANDASIDEAIAICDAMLTAIAPAMADDCHVLMFTNWRYEPEFRNLLTKHGYSVDASLVWVKENHTSGDLTGFAPQHERILHARKGKIEISPRLSDVFMVKREHHTEHPTEKPTALLKKLIECTTIAGELVVDPFAGTGATVVSALETGRLALGIELDENWYMQGLERLADEHAQG